MLLHHNKLSMNTKRFFIFAVTLRVLQFHHMFHQSLDNEDHG